MAGSMGPHLKGFAPPFSPTGRSSIVPAMPTSASHPGARPRPIHAGIMARFLADGDYLAKLIPRPLRATERTPEVSVFLNVSVPTGVELDPDLAELEEWRLTEALFTIPCEYEGVEYAWRYLMYVGSQRFFYSATMFGHVSKLAELDFLFPAPPHPPRGEVAAGTTMKATVSRFGQRIITSTFRATEPADPQELLQTVIGYGPGSPDVGMRYIPDMVAANRGKLLVHDLVANDIDDWELAEAWSGEATITFGTSEREELHHLEPIEMLESYYVSGLTYTNPGVEVIYDYLAD